jgi:triphosphoribosyl-dephospho-CoA synthetase
MTDDLDIWRAAQLLVKRHGPEAAIQAAMRADELLAEGDIDGQRIWLRIVKAIEELQRPKPEPGETIN